ncbi:MAG TPA: GNAT family N-acetyltransferase [Ktedonobacteraceae bacterium]|nr:GNAT family N-acetyltransferase [Ktedonobacteraceae bacterium]
MSIFRPARQTDLASAYDVFYQNEVRDTPNPPPSGGVPTDLSHILETGTTYVAEQEGAIVGFAASITRGSVTFLTDLFVLPDQQSSRLGQALLAQVMPENNTVRCTFSSTDPRALALYIRSGMQPQWPHFCLRLTSPLREHSFDTAIEIHEGQVDDPTFVEWDAQVSGRWRPVDHAHWLHRQRTVPLWFMRRGNKIGYAYLRLREGTIWYPEACTLGPIGVQSAEDAVSCTLAAVNWARKHAGAEILLINVPGPHPALAPLLNVGFHITYVETFVSTAITPFFDTQRYIASGSNLF